MTPTQTAGEYCITFSILCTPDNYYIAELASLQQYLSLFEDFLTQTGVGALPLPPALSTQPGHNAHVELPTEEALLKEATRKVATLYAQQKQIKENNNVVASLLGATTLGSGLTSSTSSASIVSEAPRR